MRTFTDVWVSMNPQQKQRLAEKVGNSKVYLSQIAHGKRTPSIALVQRLSAADTRIHAGMFV
jgi:transcriptional regulator with XRE-family HTH domain